MNEDLKSNIVICLQDMIKFRKKRNWDFAVIANRHPVTVVFKLTDEQISMFPEKKTDKVIVRVGLEVGFEIEAGTTIRKSDLSKMEKLSKKLTDAIFMAEHDNLCEGTPGTIDIPAMLAQM